MAYSRVFSPLHLLLSLAHCNSCYLIFSIQEITGIYIMYKLLVFIHLHHTSYSYDYKYCDWTDTQTICEGWFCKAATSGIGKSHRRYFKLVKEATPHQVGKHNSAVLKYFTTDKNKGLRGHYPLGPGSCLWKVDKRGFCLKTEFGTLRATCSSQKTRDTWVRQLH